MGEHKGIFQRIKSALLGTEVGAPILKIAKSSNAPEVDVRFAENFTDAGGYFVFCESNIELIANLRLLMEEQSWNCLFSDDEHLDRMLRHSHVPFRNLLGLSECQAKITPCEGLIANQGFIMMSAGTDKGRQLAACPKAHIVVAYTSQLAFSSNEAKINLQKLSDIKATTSFTFIGGPNSSNDTKKNDSISTCTPRELYVFLVED
jgi:L-lactate dehydrogenase complex protein LldG